MWKIPTSSIQHKELGLCLWVLYALICFISTAPQETTDGLFLEICPNSSYPGLVARAAAAQPILIKMGSLKCCSMEKDIKDFIISSQNSVWIMLHPSPPFPGRRTATHVPFCQLKHQRQRQKQPSRMNSVRSHDRERSSAVNLNLAVTSHECKISDGAMSDSRSHA